MNRSEIHWNHPQRFRIRILITMVIIGANSACVFGQEGLKSHVPPGFHIGGVLHGNDESFLNPHYRGVAVRDFNAVTSSVYLPWGAWPDPGLPPNFEKFANVVDWAAANGLKTHGHALVYPDANSKSNWWGHVHNKDVEPLLRSFVESLCRSRAGQVWVWDVVNEVMADDHEAMDFDGLRTHYKEYRAMGPDYVGKAFQWAAAADPKARLIINTTGCATINNKSNRLLNYVQKLRSRGVRVDGVGFQMHFLELGSNAPDVRGIQANFQRFANAGFEIYITEFDVAAIQTRNPSPDHPGFSTPNVSQLDRQRRHYETVLRIALSQPACKAFLMWDFADDYSWLHKTKQQIHTLSAGVYTYPAPFWCGKHCPISPKPAYHGMMNVLKTSPKIWR